MKAFTIENETNNIMVHATAKDAEALENAVSFRNEAGLAKLAADWPAARLIEIWNSLPGVTPVRVHQWEYCHPVDLGTNSESGRASTSGNGPRRDCAYDARRCAHSERRRARRNRGE